MSTQIEPLIDNRAELTVVLHILADSKAIFEIPRLLPEHFEDIWLKPVFSACKTIEEKGGIIEPLTVTNQMEADGTLSLIGGVSGLKKLYGSRGWGSIKEAESAILVKWQRRQLLNIAGKINEESPKPETEMDDLLAEVATKVDQVANYVSEARIMTTAQQLEEFYQYTQSRREAGEDSAMPFTGIAALDAVADVTGGSMVIVSGSTGSGKSSFYNTIINAHLDMGLPIDSWSGENSVRVQINRIIASRTGIWANDLKHGRYLDSPELVTKFEAARQEVNDGGLIYTAGNMSAPSIISRINYLHTTKGIKTFLFDRLELVDVSEYSRDIEVGRAMLMERLRTLAVSLDIIIVMACQLRKSYESRPMCQPEIVDLKGTSAIGDSATHVFMLTRPEYHGITEDENGRSTAGRGKVMLLKNTEGELVDVDCKFNGNLALWHEAEDEDFDIPPASFSDPKPYGSNVIAGYSDEVDVEF